MGEKSKPRLDTYRQAQKRRRSAVARLAAGREGDFKSEGMYPPESRSLAVRLGVRSFYRSGEPMRTMEIPDGANSTLASELLADAQRNVARVYRLPWPLVANPRVAP